MAKCTTLFTLALSFLLALKALSQDLDLSDAFDEITTKAPGPPIPKPKTDEDRGFDLEDALDPNNDRRTRGGGISDNAGGYVPDKGNGRGGGDSVSDTNYGDTTAETGTIAGIASAVVMALVGAVGSYVSYQKKKLCFGIQQNLNAQYVKGENPEEVVCQEPQVQQTRFEPPNAQPPNRL